MVKTTTGLMLSIGVVLLTCAADSYGAELTRAIPSAFSQTPIEAVEVSAAPVPASMDLWSDTESSAACDGNCADASCNDCAERGRCASWCSPRWYGQAELLTWWTKGNQIPALVTTSPDGTPQADAGILGRPGTQVLHGGNSVDGNYRVGMRFTLGRWLDDCRTTGIELTWISLGDGANTGNYSIQSVGNPLSPILARPFFNILGNQQDAALVAFPGQVEGGIDVRTSSEMHSMSLLLRRNLWQAGGDRIDVVGGYRYFRYREGLTVDQRLVVTDPNGPVATGTTIDLLDSFSTENDFHGGEIGIAAVMNRGAWSFDMLTKLAVGNMYQQVNIRGTNTVAVPNQPPVTASGGLLALATNMGQYDRNDFAFLPELNLNARYCLSQNISLTMGYSLLWITNVMRSGDQIDTGINVSQLPANGNALIGPPRPAPILSDTTMWIQGVNLGVAFTY